MRIAKKGKKGRGNGRKIKIKVLEIYIAKNVKTRKVIKAR